MTMKSEPGSRACVSLGRPFPHPATPQRGPRAEARGYYPCPFQGRRSEARRAREGVGRDVARSGDTARKSACATSGASVSMRFRRDFRKRAQSPLQFAAAYTIHNIKIQSPERKRRATGRQPQHAAARVSRTVAHAGIVFGLLETVVLSTRRFRSGLRIYVLKCVHGREGAIFSQPLRERCAMNLISKKEGSGSAIPVTCFRNEPTTAQPRSITRAPGTGVKAEVIG